MKNQNKTKNQLMDELRESRHKHAKLSKEEPNLKQTEQSLRESEERYRKLFECITDAIWIFDAETLQFEDVNRAALDLLGYSKQEFLKLFAKDISNEKDETLRNIKVAYKKGPDRGIIPLRYCRKKDGTIFPCELAWGKFVSKGRIKIVGVARDITESIRIMKKLENSENLLIETQQISKVGGWEIDLSNGEGNWTEEAYRIHEIPCDYKIRPEDAFQFYPGAARLKIKAAFQRLIATGEHYDLELPFVTAKKNRLWVRTIGRAIKADGKVVRVFGIIVDITEHKHAEAVKHKSEERFRIIFESAPIGIDIVSLDGKPLFVNRMLQNQLGYTEKELCQKRFADYTHPDDREESEKFVKQLIGGEKDFLTMEKRYIRKDRSVLYARTTVAPVKNINGKVEYLIAMVEDISEYRQVLDALRESGEKYRAIFEQAVDSITLIDAESGELVEFNESAHINLGYTREEFAKLQISDIEALESVEEFSKNMEKVTKEGSDVFETKHRTKDGCIRCILVSSKIIYIQGKRFFHGIWRDITELKIAEMELAEKNSALREMIRQIEIEKQKLTEQVQVSIEQLVLPLLIKLEKRGSQLDRMYIRLMEDHFKSISSSLGINMLRELNKLTQKEIEICNLVRSGLSSKEIANLFDISYRTVETHRNNIRKKLGIKNRRINLITHLKTNTREFKS